MMSSNNPSGWGSSGVGQRIEEAIELIEMELRHAIAYVNEAVIPQVRKESISAMRLAADTLRISPTASNNKAAAPPENRKTRRRSARVTERSPADKSDAAGNVRSRTGGGAVEPVP